MFAKLMILTLLPFINYPPNELTYFYSPQQEKSKKTEDFNIKKILPEEGPSIEFYESLRVIPVKFIAKENDRLIAQFISNLMLQEISFKILPEVPSTFIKLDGDWGEKIETKEFLKEMKKDFWLIIYSPDSDNINILFEAQQFKNWSSINASFAADPNQITKSAETVAYWQRMRMKMVYFYNIRDDDANWIFVTITNDPPDPADDETIELANNVRFKRRNNDIVILENGTFTIDEKCIFNTIEIRDPKSKLLIIPFTGKNAKIRAQVVSRSYFLNNVSKIIWMCFYDKDSLKLLLVVAGDPIIVATDK